MQINNITQTISTIPPAGARGVDVQSIFVTKQEDFQDHLQGTTVTELNTLKDQLNTRIGEINSTTTIMNGYANTASTGATTATTKAGEASTSASEALTYRNQASTSAAVAATSAASLTPSGILAAIKTVDGSGSGLDADLLDGKDSTQYVWLDKAGGETRQYFIKTETGGGARLGAFETGEWLNYLDLADRLYYKGIGLLRVDEKAMDSELLDGKHSTDFVGINNNNFTYKYGMNVTGQNIMQIGTYHGGSWKNALEMSGGVSSLLYWDSLGSPVHILSSGYSLTTSPLGYASSSGVGAVVSQPISKSTPIAINKLTGRISTHDSTLAPGDTVDFLVTNSLYNNEIDLVAINTGGNGGGYTVEAKAYNTNQFMIRIKNVSNVSLSEVLSFTFLIFKGANS